MKKKHIYWLIGLIILIITILIAILSLPQDMYNEPQSTQPTTPHSHIWGEWITEQEATCSSKGLKSRSCECGEKEEISFAMLEHSFGYWDIVTPAKCEVEGVEERICSKCELKETRSIEAIVHSGDAWTIINNEKQYKFQEENKHHNTC